MKKHKTLGNALSMLTASALLLSLCVIPSAAADSAAAPTAVFENTSGDGGSNGISLSAERTFQASIPVDMTEAEAKEAASSVTWTLTPDADAPDYLDDTQFPNQTEGGPLSAWLCQDGETPLFTDVATAAETVDGQVYLTVPFANQCYFGDDLSVPHSNGGSYMDVCGYFTLSAGLDGKTLGSVDLKVAPYDNFHTMSEIYDELDALVDYAAGHTDLYVEQFSMGQSQGDNGLESLDMPYLIVAKDKAAVDKWQEIKAEAESDPTALLKKLESGALGDYQVPVMYSNIHANEVAASDGILAFAWMLVETAASESGTIDYDKLTGFTAAGKAELAEQMGPAGEEGSVAVPDLVANDATYLGYIKGENADGTTASISTQVELEKYYTIDTVTVDVDELLSDVFFIIVPEENVEGRTYLTRTSSGGFDLNRDNSFQTQAETQNMARLIAEWNPVSLTEFHGRVQAFQCEPCDPPHEPNFEYDLLAEHLMGGGEALGIAAVANNGGHNSYVIPQRDYLTYTGAKTADGDDQTQWLDPWDDMSTSYTPQYAMLHGTVSYTVEVPAYDDYMVQGVAYGQLGQSVYIAEHKDGYLTNQTKIFERGVTNANSDAYELVGQWFCDQYDVEGAEADLFRPEYDGEGQNGNFYPECYIIPMDGVHQSNLQAAAEMMEYLTRNGVQVSLTDQSFTYNGVEYPAGTLIVSMYQAKRSVANGVLYDGTVITGWPVLYSEGITAFDKVRGFDMVVCAEPAAYKTISAACGDVLDYEETLDYVASLTSSFSGVKDAQVVLMNASEDSTAAVNALLKAGKSVSLITEGQYEGSFLVSYADWQSVAGDYLLSGVGVTDAPAALAIPKAPVVYISGKPADNDKGFVKTTLVSGSYEYNYDRQAMRTLGFTVTDDPAKADIIVGNVALDQGEKGAAAVAAVKAGTPYIATGSDPLEYISKNLVTDLTYTTLGMEALHTVTYPTDSLITASYAADGDYVLYTYSCGVLTSVPAGATVLIQAAEQDSFIAGCCLNENGTPIDGFVEAIALERDGMDLTIFANSVNNRAHQQDDYRYVTNAIYAKMSTGGAGFTHVPASHWAAGGIAYAVENGLMTGTSRTTFAPAAPTTRGMMMTILARQDGVSTSGGGTWYEKGMAWAKENGISDGSAPNGSITREQLAVMLYRASGADAGSAELSAFADSKAVSSWAAEAMSWAVEQGVITGKKGNLLDPGGTASRAEVAVMLQRYLG